MSDHGSEVALIAGRQRGIRTNRNSGNTAISVAFGLSSSGIEKIYCDLSIFAFKGCRLWQ